MKVDYLGGVSAPVIPPVEGNKYVNFYVTLTNLNMTHHGLGNQYEFKLYDSENKSHSPALESFRPGGLGSITDSKPGDKVNGTLVYEISNTAIHLALDWTALIGFSVVFVSPRASF